MSLAHLISRHGSCCVILQNNQELYIVKKEIEFYNPDIEVLLFPERDIIPYTNQSASTNIIEERIHTLYRLHTARNLQVTILVSVNALCDMLPDCNLLFARSKQISLQESCSYNDLIEILHINGFARSEMACHSGDYVIRGSLIDVVIKDRGYRFDYFGDQLEAIRLFNPHTQVSERSIEKVNILPVKEIIYSDDILSIFKYKSLVEKKLDAKSTLYNQVIEERVGQGYEQYLPLFYNHNHSFLSYLPENIGVFADCDYISLIQKRYKYTFHIYDNINQIEKDGVLTPDILFSNQEQLLNSLEQVYVDPEQKYAYRPIPNFYNRSVGTGKNAISLFKEWLNTQTHIKNNVILCHNNRSAENIQNMLENYDIYFSPADKYQNCDNGNYISVMSLDKGFSFQDTNIISEYDLVHKTKEIKRRATTRNIKDLLMHINDLGIGEAVVHKQHGIGKLIGLQVVTVMNNTHDCLCIEYKDNDKLLLPVEHLDLVNKYGNTTYTLSKLGGAQWQLQKSKVQKDIMELAHDIVKVAAKRKLYSKQQISIPEKLYEDFCADFPYIETEDQLQAVLDIREDMIAGKLIDRLICGDAGFGKTEVAIRAAFMLIMGLGERKKQAILIAPTTLLAQQHYNSFISRFRSVCFSNGKHINIRCLSRLTTTHERKLIYAGLASGEVDIVIGTHAIFNNSIIFHNLGLMIIDEEQSFGVKQKEKIKQRYNHVHTISLSATPIPRTLQMSLTGIKDLSLITIPPHGRKPVITKVIHHNIEILKEIFLLEYERGGQSFYVTPRIVDIEELGAQLRESLPNLKIVIAHGKIKPDLLDKIVYDFHHKKYDIMISTCIIESGIDIANVNTIVINNADYFGLSQLYQLKGRVGRNNIQAYAYLVQSKRAITKHASMRLSMICSLDSIGGQGFNLASYDMDMRGFGNLLGDKQSGNIKEVGVELYQDMLLEAIDHEKQEGGSVDNSNKECFVPTVNLQASVIIPEQYISDYMLRINMYRRISLLKSEAEIDNIKLEMQDRFGDVPESVEYLLDVVYIKNQSIILGIEKVDIGEKASALKFSKQFARISENLVDYILNMKNAKFKNEYVVVIKHTKKSYKDNVKSITNILDIFCSFEI